MTTRRSTRKTRSFNVLVSLYSTNVFVECKFRRAISIGLQTDMNLASDIMNLSFVPLLQRQVKRGASIASGPFIQFLPDLDEEHPVREPRRSGFLRRRLVSLFKGRATRCLRNTIRLAEVALKPHLQAIAWGITLDGLLRPY